MLTAGTVQRGDASGSVLMQTLLQRLPTSTEMSVMIAESSLGQLRPAPGALLPLAFAFALALGVQPRCIQPGETSIALYCC